MCHNVDLLRASAGSANRGFFVRSRLKHALIDLLIAAVVLVVVYFCVAGPAFSAEPGSGVMLHQYHAAFHCPPCERQDRALERLHKRYPAMWIAKQVGDHPGTIRQYERPEHAYELADVAIRGYPTLYVYRHDGAGWKFVKRYVGFVPRQERELASMIRKAAQVPDGFMPLGPPHYSPMHGRMIQPYTREPVAEPLPVYRPVPRGTWGIWPIPFSLGHYYW